MGNMIRGLTLTIFLSVILFSCSKSNEDKLVGSWQLDLSKVLHPEANIIYTFNSDKTFILSYKLIHKNIEHNPYGLGQLEDEIGAWKLNEATMEICLGESIETLDECATITSIDDHRFCLDTREKINCFDKYK